MNEANIANIASYGAYERPAPLAGRMGQPAWEVREDKGSYIPDFLSFGEDEDLRELHAAADKHASHLRKAERDLDQAINLVGVLLASLEDVGDDRAAQTETVLKVIEQKLEKVHSRLDKHDTRHTKLFFAYCELKEKRDGDEE